MPSELTFIILFYFHISIFLIRLLYSLAWSARMFVFMLFARLKRSRSVKDESGRRRSTSWSLVKYLCTVLCNRLALLAWGALVKEASALPNCDMSWLLQKNQTNKLSIRPVTPSSWWLSPAEGVAGNVTVHSAASQSQGIYATNCHSRTFFTPLD